MNDYFSDDRYTLHQVKVIFKKCNVSSNTAERLVCNALDLSREAYHLDCKNIQITNCKALSLLNNYLNDSIANKPWQYIVGCVDFWKFTFDVTESTLIPRPETELIIEKALQYFSNRLHDKLNILDLGTGSGILAICLKHEFANSRVIACDISDEALRVASRNAKHILQSASNHIKFIRSNWYEDLHSGNINCDKGGVFDIIVSNPPYISLDEFTELDCNVKRYEPKIALTDNFDGLSHYYQIIQGSKSYLKKDGILILEHGFKQRVALMKILIENDFKIIDTMLDLSGLDRILVAQL